MSKQYTFALLLLIFQSLILNAQVDTVVLQEKSFVEYSGAFSAYSGTFDSNDNRYLYVASNQLGLKVFKTINENLVEINSFPNSNFNSLQVLNVDQVGDFLYLALGDFQSIFGSPPGIAILNVADPENIVIEGVWSTDDFNKGSAIIKIVDEHAYLGMMDSGLAIINVANPDSMYYVSHVVPDYFFPQTPGIFEKPHTRGLAIRGDFAFLCQDAGGLRVVDISDKNNPIEVAKYVNQYVFGNAGRAYNNIVLDGDYAYLALDYCGVEVVNISDPLNPQPVSLFDPWDCGNSPWEDGTGHTNELVKVPGQDILFVSAGDSELLVLDISNPSALKIAGQFGELLDSTVVWGLDLSENQIALFQVDNSLVPDNFPQPYRGHYGGVKLLEWDLITATRDIDQYDFKVFPNPFSSSFNLVLPPNFSGAFQFKMYNQLGQLLLQKNVADGNFRSHMSFDFSSFPEGLYYFSIENDKGIYSRTLVKH